LTGYPEEKGLKQMSLIVQKFGGSSVKNAERIRHVAEIIERTYQAGNDVIVVLSAQGDTTDDLIERAQEINPRASNREMDMLLSVGEQISISLCAMELERRGLRCVSLAGWQAGVQTSAVYGEARIKRIDAEHYHAGPGRVRYQRRRAGGYLPCVPVPDFHGCGRRLYHRPPARAKRQKAQRDYL